MKEMKKVLCLLVALCMVLTLFPSTTYAKETVNNDFWNNMDTDSFWPKYEWNGNTQNVTLYADEDSTLPVTALEVGGVDALTTPTGDGWSFDSETGTLTLDNAEISTQTPFGIAAVGNLTIVAENDGVNSCFGAYGIYVDGNLSIKNCNLNAKGTMNGMIVTGLLTVENSEILSENLLSLTDAINNNSEYVPCGIFANDVILTDSKVDSKGTFIGLAVNLELIIENSIVSATSITTVTEAVEIGTPIPPSAILCTEISIARDSNVTCSSEFAGIYSFGGVEVLDSVVSATASYYGIYSEYPMYFENGDITIVNDITLDELYAGPQPLVLAIGGPCSEFTALNTEFDLTSLIAGIFVDVNQNIGTATISLSDCEMNIEAGYAGIITVNEADIMNSEIDVDITLSVEDTLEYAELSGFTIPSSGVCVANQDGKLTICQSSIAVSDAWLGVQSFTTEIATSNIEIDSLAHGFYAGNVTLQNCPSVSLTGDYNATEEYINAGGQVIVFPATIMAMGALTIDGCEDVNVEGSYTGLVSFGNELVIKNSNVDLTAGGMAGFGAYITIENSNVEAEVEWTTEETRNKFEIFPSGALEDSYVFAAANGINVIDCEVIQGGACEVYATQTADGNAIERYIFVENELPSKTVSISNDPCVKGHDYGEWYTVNESTCEDVGLKQRDCANCDAFETEEIAVIDHNYEATVVEATCTEDGYTMHTCSMCEDTYVDAEVPALGHNYVDGVCTVCFEEELPEEIASGECGDNVIWYLDEEGQLTITPAVATFGLRREVDLASEEYVMFDFEKPEDAPWYPYRELIKKVVIEPLVANIGSNAFNGYENLEEVEIGNDVQVVGENAFSNCTDVSVEFKGDEPEVAGTAFEGTTAKVTYPAENETWTDEVQNNYGENSVVVPEKPEDVVDDPCKDGHDMGDWEVVSDSTCTEEGLKRKDCKNCEAYTTAKIEKKSHVYKSVVTEPTCTEQGYTTHTCECGDSYKDSYVDELGHDFENGSCTVCGEKDPDYVKPEQPSTPSKPSFGDNIKDMLNKVFDKIFGKPSKPETPDKPEVPEEPEVPEQPEQPEEPEVPETPEQPEEPEVPETPNKPTRPSYGVFDFIFKIIFRK